MKEGDEDENVNENTSEHDQRPWNFTQILFAGIRLPGYLSFHPSPFDCFHEQGQPHKQQEHTAYEWKETWSLPPAFGARHLH